MENHESNPALVRSVLDTDLYKLTMQQAVLKHFPEARVKYRFTNRSKNMTFNRECLNAVLSAVSHLSDLLLQPSELAWLSETCPFFSQAYLSYLSAFRFKPSEQVHIQLVGTNSNGDGQIEIEVEGLWVETILYEVPLMAILSETYFKTVDLDWDIEGQEELAYAKGKTLLYAGCLLSEFGTRRRRSYDVHETVLKGLIRARDDFQGKDGVEGKLTGTSNIHFAHKFRLTPIGTIAHEWTMGIAALLGVEHCNSKALQLWEEVYPTYPSNALHIALTDTFTSNAFFEDFTKDTAESWRGIRHDSGSPITYIEVAKATYEKLGVDYKGKKIIVFSDGLNVDSCVKLREACAKAGFIPSFGVGTFLTNDFKKKTTGGKDVSKPLNIVIKLSEVDGLPCVKLSDDLTKTTGKEDTVKDIKRRLKIQ